MFSRCFLGLGCLLIFAGCASPLSPAEYVGQRKNALLAPVILDVRTASEFRQGHIPGAVNISVFTLPFRLGRIPITSKDEPLVVYCAHGPRAGLAGFILRVAGFKNVRHLEGDMKGWRAEGLPVEGSPATGPDG